MINTNIKKIEEILSRGVEEVIVREDLKNKLLSGKKLRIYFGIDPTGSLLHLGHSVVLWKLREFQELGHEVILLIGDFTAKIGDPSGRDNTRAPLTDKQIKENMKDYKKQASKILDFGTSSSQASTKVKIKYNSQWLSKLKFKDILKLSSCFTLKQMEQRDMFQNRIKEDLPIGLHEFMYPLMQGYDSVAMDVDLEIAGSDQMFNMMVGRNLQKIYNNKDKDILTIKLLLGTDGRKMSKTYNNAIYLTDAPADMYGKIMSIKDDLIDEYFELATLLPQEEMIEIKKSLNNPRNIKARLAKEIVTLYHGESKAQKAEDEFNKTFRDKNPVYPEFITNREEMFYPEALYVSGVASSISEAKRLIMSGSVEINGNIDKDWKKNITINEKGLEIRVGKRRFVKIKFKK